MRVLELDVVQLSGEGQEKHEEVIQMDLRERGANECLGRDGLIWKSISKGHASM